MAITFSRALYIYIPVAAIFSKKIDTGPRNINYAGRFAVPAATAPPPLSVGGIERGGERSAEINQDGGASRKKAKNPGAPGPPELIELFAEGAGFPRASPVSLSFSSFLLEFRVSRKSRASSVSFFYLLSFIGIFRDESHFRRRARARDASMGRGDALIAAAVAGYLFHFLMLREWFPSPLAPIGPHTHTRRERERERERENGIPGVSRTLTHI